MPCFVLWPDIEDAVGGDVMRRGGFRAVGGRAASEVQLEGGFDGRGSGRGDFYHGEDDGGRRHVLNWCGGR